MHTFYLPWLYLAGNLLLIGFFLVLHLAVTREGGLTG